MAGYTTNYINRRFPKGKIIATLLVVMVSADLLTLAYKLMQQPFVLPPYRETVTPAPYPIAYTIENYIYRLRGPKDSLGEGIDYTRAYTNIQNGYGSLAYCSVLGPSPVVHVVETEDSQFLRTTSAGNTGHAELIEWTPNRITIKASANEPADLIINANYAPGWNVSINGQNKPAKDIKNLLATSFPPGEHIITFTFRNEGFYIGLAITIITITTAVIASFGKGLDFSKVRQSNGELGSREKA